MKPLFTSALLGCATIIPCLALGQPWSDNDESKRNWVRVSKDLQVDIQSRVRKGPTVTVDTLPAAGPQASPQLGNITINCKSYEYLDNNEAANWRALSQMPTPTSHARGESLGSPAPPATNNTPSRAMEMPASRIRPGSNEDRLYRRLCKKN